MFGIVVHVHLSLMYILKIILFESFYWWFSNCMWQIYRYVRDCATNYNYKNATYEVIFCEHFFLTIEQVINNRYYLLLLHKIWIKTRHNTILTLFKIKGQKGSPYQFFLATSTNIEIIPQNFLTFSLKPFATLVWYLKAMTCVSPKLLYLNQEHHLETLVFLVKFLLKLW